MFPDVIEVLQQEFLAGHVPTLFLELLESVVAGFDALVGSGHKVFDPVHLDALLVFDLIQAVCHRLVGAEEGLRPLLSGVDILDDKHQAGGLFLVGLMRLI